MHTLKVILGSEDVNYASLYTASTATITTAASEVSIKLPNKRGVSKFHKSANRRIQRIPYNFVFVRDKLERMRIEYRSMLTVLERRVMVLRPLDVNRHILSEHVYGSQANYKGVCVEPLHTIGTNNADVKSLLRCVVVVM